MLNLCYDNMAIKNVCVDGGGGKAYYVIHNFSPP